ncbi:MAG: alkaline phosphatase family protein [Pseudolysinimonas sp.]
MPEAPSTTNEREVPRPTRRDILNRALWGAAGLAVGASGTVGIEAVLSAGSKLPHRERPEGAGFDHLVVLMFENRSFDNALGFLYGENGSVVPAGQTFEGLDLGYSNRAADGTIIAAHSYTGPTDEIFAQPTPNAGEQYPHITTQVFGVANPPPGAKADMSGFVIDYMNTYRAATGQQMTVSQAATIMGSFTPPMLPVLSTLARSFAVYDHWHSAVPSQTYANRSFVHASTSHGFVINKGAGGFGKWIDPAQNTGDTVFNRLEAAGLEWAVYYDESQLISFTGLIHAPQLERYWKTRFRTMAQFHRDAAAGTLPAYSFIEPRMIYNHNDMHPPTGKLAVQAVDGTTVVSGGVSDVRAGEVLLHEVYTSIKESGSKAGSNALNTMLLVAFDETGGTFDHVPPPSAIPPDTLGPGEDGFEFDRLGVRVPAIAISAYTAAGSVIHDEMHHGAIIKTLCDRYDLAHLTERDRTARSLANAINATSAREPASWPTTTAHYVPANPESLAPDATTAEHPLTEPAVGLLSLLLAKYGQPGDPIPTTYGAALELLEKRGRQLFGS